MYFCDFIMRGGGEPKFGFFLFKCQTIFAHTFVLDFMTTKDDFS